MANKTITLDLDEYNELLENSKKIRQFHYLALGQKIIFDSMQYIVVSYFDDINEIRYKVQSLGTNVDFNIIKPAK